MEICLHLLLLEEEPYQQLREQVIRISAMLTKMVQAKMAPPMPDVPVPVPLPSSSPEGE